MSGRYDDDRDGTKLSRGEAEILCVLHVVGTAGCPARELARRLGLSDALAADLAEGMDWLVNRGLLELADERFTRTDAGRLTLAERLHQLGLDR